MRLPLIVAVIPALVLCNSAVMAQVTGMASPTLRSRRPRRLAWERVRGFPNRHSSGRYRNRISRRSPTPGATGAMSMPAAARHARHLGLHLRDVRIDIELRRWRNGRGQRGASHRATSGMSGHARDGADRGRVWNVRRRLKQRRFVVHSDVNIAHDARRGARTGIPLGSIEIGNLGVSSGNSLPMVSVSPSWERWHRVQSHQSCPRLHLRPLFRPRSRVRPPARQRSKRLLNT